ncbi:hypothetical protein RhiirA4_487111 [Rhizophagus irregularis]|uniref:Uncharacterized protein n=1 Tax=Rhizophagus irregularis TaxID=588596 RepID=A0A2I1HS69_9GLOM|nr:hypothetical protein RhiirA4_487111 [Rhizophagus irregularis]
MVKFQGYKLTLNKESGLRCFDIKIEPIEKAIYKIRAILEIKIVKKNEKKNNGNDELQNKAEEELKQISEKCYHSSISEFTEKLIECGFVF